MSDRVFVDTNVFLYAIDRAEKVKQSKARKILKDIVLNKHGVISTQVVEEAYNGATKKIKVVPAKARRWIEQFENFEIVNLDISIIKSGIDCSILNQLSFWDGLIIAAAEAAKCQFLFTEDMNSGQLIRGVRIVNPFN